MINLLPPTAKSSITYARRNVILVKWMMAIMGGVAGIAVVVIVGYVFINQSMSSYAAEVEQSKQRLEEQKMDETKKRTDEISASIKLALQVLSKQVIFSELLKQIGAVMPPGSSLQNLSISKLDGGIDLQAVATDYQTATQVQVNLQDPQNKVFEKVDIVNITCSNEDSEALDTDYPCQIIVRALFSKNSPYIYTNKNAKDAQ